MASKSKESEEEQPLFEGDDEPISLVDSSDKFKDFALSKDINEVIMSKSCCYRLRQRVTGKCLCGLSIIFYLLLCVALSGLYVGLRYTHESEQEDEPAPWIPGTPTIEKPPKPLHTTQIKDLPYTEWVPRRWTYSDQPFADWPTLPSSIDNILQVTQGTVGKQSGVWILTELDLFFAIQFHEEVQFLNVSETIGLEVTAGSAVAVATNGKVYLATPNNITLLDCSEEIEDYCDVVTDNTHPLPFSFIYSAVLSLSTDTLWLGTDEGLYKATTLYPSPLSTPEEFFFDGDIVLTNVSEVKGQIRTLLWRSSVSCDPHYTAFVQDEPSCMSVKYKDMAFSTSRGTWTAFDFHRNANLFGVLVVGTKDRVYFYDGGHWWFEWVSVWSAGLGGSIDGPPSSMAVGGSGEIYIANNVSLTRINTDYTFDRIGPLEGLPYNELNALCFVNYQPLYPDAVKGQRISFNYAGILWMGTRKGYTLFDLQTSEFKGYFYGPRWHSGEEIKAIVNAGLSIVMVTDAGLTFVTPETWTLEQKASHYQKMLARHTREPGLVSDCPLTNYNTSTCSPYTTDNDGLWTSWLVASEALRYAVTKDPTARENAWSLYQGMAFLNNVTGIHGLMARSVLHENSSLPSGEWHHSTTNPGWVWKGDTSSDEVAGHMFAYPLVHDLVARDEGEKEAVRELVDSIVGYIKSNDYHLIDITNQSTRWGVWAPSQLNLNISWADEHGLNSLQILSYLLSAYRLTGRTEYWQAWKELTEEHHYGLNMINQKITFPRDDNYSDDELAFLPYFTYYYSLKKLKHPIDGSVSHYGNLSLERTWRVVGKEKSSAWTAIYAYSRDTPRDPDLVDALLWNLRTWPLELIEWRTTNSHRMDIRDKPEQDRDFRSNSQSVRLLPANERGQLRWNANPYELDNNGSSSEMDPGAWLLPYWLARWSGML